jgi:hypothetical protein
LSPCSCASSSFASIWNGNVGWFPHSDEPTGLVPTVNWGWVRIPVRI